MIMPTSTLSRLLELLEDSQGAISIQTLARELGVTQSRVENMLDYWIQKGKIKASNALADCGGCGTSDYCPFILDMPKTFELIHDKGEKTDEIMYPVCRI
jgi:hypothetical protein